MANTYWDQSRFNETFRRYLDRLESDKIPNAINKKGYFLARRAVTTTRKKEPFQITRELGKVVMATRKDGSTGLVPVGFVVAAIRAAHNWAEAKMTRGEKNKRSVTTKRAWLMRLRKKFSSMLGGRKQAAGYMALGWHSVVMGLAPYVRNKSGQPYMQNPARAHGRPKGRVKLAVPGSPSVMIENIAQARSEKRAGLLRLGGPDLDKAFVEETADMNRFLDEEALKEETERFNREQR
jgi:hypothetical protein